MKCTHKNGLIIEESMKTEAYLSYCAEVCANNYRRTLHSLYSSGKKSLHYSQSRLNRSYKRTVLTAWHTEIKWSNAILNITNFVLKKHGVYWCLISCYFILIQLTFKNWRHLTLMCGGKVMELKIKMIWQ